MIVYKKKCSTFKFTSFSENDSTIKIVYVFLKLIPQKHEQESSTAVFHYETQCILCLVEIGSKHPKRNRWYSATNLEIRSTMFEGCHKCLMKNENKELSFGIKGRVNSCFDFVVVGA